jgi:hypothetical protein
VESFKQKFLDAKTETEDRIREQAHDAPMNHVWSSVGSPIKDQILFGIRLWVESAIYREVA